jgi:hypothetical protein
MSNYINLHEIICSYAEDMLVHDNVLENMPAVNFKIFLYYKMS